MHYTQKFYIDGMIDFKAKHVESGYGHGVPLRIYVILRRGERNKFDLEWRGNLAVFVLSTRVGNRSVMGSKSTAIFTYIAPHLLAT
jgi:hypothetical protein